MTPWGSFLVGVALVLSTACWTSTECIGGGLCLDIECVTDSDCGDGRVCNEDGACGPPSCLGTPTACEDIHDEAECRATLGCHHAVECTGTPSHCGSASELLACIRLDGCTWNRNSQACEVDSIGCALQFNGDDCGKVPGCTWGGTCSGSQPYSSCAEISDRACEDTRGCHLETP